MSYGPMLEFCKRMEHNWFGLEDMHWWYRNQKGTNQREENKIQILKFSDLLCVKLDDHQRRQYAPRHWAGVLQEDGAQLVRYLLSYIIYVKICTVMYKLPAGSLFHLTCTPQWHAALLPQRMQHLFGHGKPLSSEI